MLNTAPVPELSILLPDGSAKVIPLSGSRITIGRTSDNDFAFPDEAILSRRHVAIEYDGARWFIEDLGSKNGTTFNSEPLTGRRAFQLGDKIGVGRMVLSLVDPNLN